MRGKQSLTYTFVLLNLKKVVGGGADLFDSGVSCMDAEVKPVLKAVVLVALGLVQQGARLHQVALRGDEQRGRK